MRGRALREEGDRQLARTPCVYMYVAKDLFSSPSPSPSLSLSHTFTSAVPFRRNFQRPSTAGRYPVLIRGELSSRFKLYDPAIKIVLADNYIDGRNCKPLSRRVLSNTLSRWRLSISHLENDMLVGLSRFDSPRYIPLISFRFIATSELNYIRSLFVIHNRPYYTSE